MPSFNGSRRRHSKQSSTSSKKKNPPPDLTLASRHYSSSSATSDTQATPRSIFPSSLRPSKRPQRENAKDAKQSPVVTKEEALRSHPTNPSPSQPGGKEIQRQLVDVFAYMETDSQAWDSPALTGTAIDSSSTSTTSSPDLSPPLPPTEPILPSPRPSTHLIEPPQMSPRYSDLEAAAIQPHHPAPRMGRPRNVSSLHSDSGISMHSGSPEQDSPVLHHKYPTLLPPSDENDSPIGFARLEPSILEHDEEPTSALVPRDHSPDFSLRPRHHRGTSWETSEGWVPEACAFQVSPQHQLSHSLSSPNHHHQQQRQQQQTYLELPSSASPPFASRSSPPHPQSSQPEEGYALLASQISTRAANGETEKVLRPIYRQFETLQNRMLLYLQDEISELESQLHDLDAAIAAEGGSSRDQEGSGGESRRSQAKLPTQLQWHRLDLLGRVQNKVEMYNRALTSYARLGREMATPRKGDVEKYREWIGRHKPVASEETGWLQKEGDLVTIPSTTSATLEGKSRTAEEARREDGRDKGVVLAVALMAMITVFKVVPYFFARVVVGIVMGVVSAVALGRAPDWRDLKGWVKGRGSSTTGAAGKTEMALFALVVGVLAVGL